MQKPPEVLLNLTMWWVHAELAKFLFYVLNERFEDTVNESDEEILIEWKNQ